MYLRLLLLGGLAVLAAGIVRVAFVAPVVAISAVLVDAPVYDFGHGLVGDVIEHKFGVRNRFETAVTISPGPGCNGCSGIHVQLPSGGLAVPGNGIAEIPVQVQLDKVGRIGRVAHLAIEQGGLFDLPLNVVGNVESQAFMDPAEVDWGNVASDACPLTVIRLRSSRERSNLKLLGAVCRHEGIAIEKVEGTPDELFLRIKAVAPLAGGRLLAFAQIVVADAAEEDIFVPIQGTVDSPVVMKPAIVEVEKSGFPISVRIELTCRSDAATLVQIEDVKVPSDDVKVEVGSGAKSAYLTVSIAGYQPRLNLSSIFVRTDLGVVAIPIRVRRDRMLNEAR